MDYIVLGLRVLVIVAVILVISIGVVYAIMLSENRENRRKK